MKVKWCDECNQEVKFNRHKDFKVVDETYIIRGTTIVVKDIKVAVCSTCGNELPDNEFDGTIVRKAKQLWREKHLL